jgi:hypothetical protein
MATNIKTFEDLAKFNDKFYDSEGFYRHLQSVIFEIYTGEINGDDLVKLTTHIATDIAHVFDDVTEVEINELKTHRKEDAKFLEDMLRLLASSDKPSIKYFMKTFVNVLSKSNPELYRSYFALLKNTGQDGGMKFLLQNPLKTAATVILGLRIFGIGRGDEPISFFPSWLTYFQTRDTGPVLHELLGDGGDGGVVVRPSLAYLDSAESNALLVDATQMWAETTMGSALHTAETSVYYEGLASVEFATSGEQALLAGAYGPLVKKLDTSRKGSVNIGRLEKNVANASRQVRTNEAAAASLWRWQTAEEISKATANAQRLNETLEKLNKTTAIVNSTAGLVDVKGYKGSTTVISQLAYGVAQAIILSDAPLTPQIAASIVSAGPRILSKIDVNITEFQQKVDDAREAYGRNQTALEASRREFNRIRDRLENVTDEILGTNQTIQLITSKKVVGTYHTSYGEYTIAELTTNQTKLTTLVTERTGLNQTLQNATVYLARNISSFNISETTFITYSAALQNMTELKSALATRMEVLRTNPPQARIESRRNNAAAAAAAADNDENVEAVNVGANGNARKLQLQVLSPVSKNGMELSIPIDIAGEQVIARLPEGQSLQLTGQQLTQYLEHSLNMGKAFSEVGKIAEKGVSRKDAIKAIKSLVYGEAFESSRQLAIAGRNNAAVTNVQATPLLKPTELALIEYYYNLKKKEAEDKVDAALAAQQILAIANANMGDKVIVSRVVSKVIEIYNTTNSPINKDKVTGTVISLLAQVKSQLDGRILNTDEYALPTVARIVYDMYSNSAYPTVPIKKIKIKLMPGWEGFGQRILLAGFEIIVIWGTVFIMSLAGDIIGVQSLSVVAEYFETCRRRAANRRLIDDARTRREVEQINAQAAALAAAPPAGVPAAAAAVVAALPPVVAPAAPLAHGAAPGAAPLAHGAAPLAPAGAAAAPLAPAAAPLAPAGAAAQAAANAAAANANAAALPFGGRRRRKTHRKQKKTNKTKKYYRRK